MRATLLLYGVSACTGCAPVPAAGGRPIATEPSPLAFESADSGTDFAAETDPAPEPSAAEADGPSSQTVAIAEDGGALSQPRLLHDASVKVGALSGAEAISNAGSAIHRVHASFHSCFQRALERDPKLQMAVVKLIMEVGARGEVVKATATGELPDYMLRCVELSAGHIQFAAPPNKSARIQTALLFTPP